MDQSWKKQYTALVEFLGKALGPDYEIVLHSFVDNEYKIIALANEHISGRTTSAPLSALALNFIFTKEYLKNDYKYNYDGISANGEKLRCSTMFIKDDEGELLGMLCINHCVEKYNRFAQSVVDFVKENYQMGEEKESEIVELFTNSSKEICEMCSYKLFHSKTLPPRLSKQEKPALITELNNRGVFHIKGAITEIAEYTGISKASIYRYLNQI